ncbi:MAG TPA: nuclear transport factor 2 family protein [Thermoanaerobaculia bacterium]|nr:nuclear transport factor 2 family protein [Thermoanaerobaculia bacterium]
MNLRIAAAVILVLPALSGGATGRDAGADALLRVEERWVDALQRRDAAVVAEILADDFLDSTYKGEIRTKAEALAGLRSPSRAETEQRLSEMRARIWGSAGVVTGINTVTARDGSFSVRVRFTDVFVRRGGAWKAVSAQETLVEGSR